MGKENLSYDLMGVNNYSTNFCMEGIINTLSFKTLNAG